MAGGDGNDRYVVDNVGDVVVEAAGAGTDEVALVAAATYTLPDNVEGLLGSAGADVLTGNAINNKINGRAGDDTISGAGGNDWLLGGLGNDILNGGDGDDAAEGNGGSDTISLGPGNDVFMYRRRDGQDASIDGGEGSGDTLCLEGKPSTYTVWINGAKNPDRNRAVVPIAGSKVDVFVGGRVPRANKAKGIATTDPATGYMKIIGFEFIRFVGMRDTGSGALVC
ncbi:hypothetical protein MNEG_4814 [Monoraphidium neglectum]|uniref:Uncharacterized protein n=1 Tax=Monoraphidium neglectum TaxID=145388 RepID=A0A0D2MJL2_9CHLO|nr:hypothetical protein MNEG_4814 [Monoraphidium neglectum]KIZ03150.1 hypothetical protein MNEG_4814 [Monoraphidium neglectum]|eukprot:XP_013902169.1 hypothetical protein MNEG_4814 [Monoraphidium neglectum]